MPVLGLARTHAPFTCQRTEEDGLVERFTRTTRALGIVAAFARPRSCAAAENCERKTSARGRQGSLAGVIASGCHDPSGTRFLPTSFPSLCLVPVQSIVVQAAVFAAPLCSCLHLDLYSGHARTPHSHHPPTAPHANIHCTSLACATPVGPATSDHFHFWADARDQANHRLQISRWTDERCTITCPLTSARTLHCHLIAHASFQP